MCGCGRAERSKWQDLHARTPARRTSCAAVVDTSPSMRWKMSVARNVICWRRLTGLFPSDTPGCDRSGWRGRGSIAWTLFCSWPAANAAGSGSAWHGRSDSSRTPVDQLHSGRAVVAEAWTLAVPPTRCYSCTAWTLWAPGTCSGRTLRRSFPRRLLFNASCASSLNEDVIYINRYANEWPSKLWQ